MWLPQITEEAAEEFRELALKEYGLELTHEEAYDAGNRLVRMFYLAEFAYRGVENFHEESFARSMALPPGPPHKRNEIRREDAHEKSPSNSSAQPEDLSS